MTEARLVSVTIEGFRGFSASQTVSFDADVVLIHGDNGTGKTSITEAIAWGLTGSLPQELLDRAKGSRPIRDVIENAYSSATPRVELRFAIAGTTIEVVRQGNSKSSNVDVRTNTSVETGEAAVASAFGCETVADLVDALMSSALLRQDAIRAAIDVGPATLHERMASIVGLDEISRFTSAAKEAVKSARAFEREAKDRLDAANAKLKDGANELQGAGAQPDVDQSSLIRAALADEIGDSGVGSLAAPVLAQIATLDELIRVGRAVNGIIDVVDRGASLFEQAVQAAAELRVRPAELRPRAQSAQLQADSMEQLASTTQRLNQAALELLGDHCPVCRQAVDEARLRERLTNDLSSAAEDLRRATETRAFASSLRTELEAAERHESVLKSRQSAVAASASEIQAAAKAAGMELQSEFLEPKRWTLLSSRLSELRSGMRRAHSVVQERVSTDVGVIRDRLLAAQSEAETAATELQVARARTRRVIALSDAAQSGADQIVASWLERLAPSFSEVFDRLQPHPTFTHLQFKPDVFYKRNVLVPQVVDPDNAVVANPLVTFSEGQLNAVALSYFLGMALNAPTTPLSFLLLDDPLQSMDVISALGFADMCRRLRAERQLILTTHDRRWAELLVRKLRPRVPGTKTIIIELEGWTREGPVIRSDVLQFGGVSRIAT